MQGLKHCCRHHLAFKASNSNATCFSSTDQFRFVRILLNWKTTRDTFGSRVYFSSHWRKCRVVKCDAIILQIFSFNSQNQIIHWRHATKRCLDMATWCGVLVVQAYLPLSAGEAQVFPDDVGFLPVAVLLFLDGELPVPAAQPSEVGCQQVRAEANARANNK